MLLTLKQRKLAKHVAAGMNGKDAAIAAGYAPTSAKSTASDVLNHNLNVQAYLYRLMDRKGLTDSKLLTTLKDGLEANKVISATVILKAGDPTVTERTADAKSVDFIDVPDHPTRHKFLETGLKLRGHLQPDTTPDAPAVNINILSAGITTEELATRLAARLRNRLVQGQANAL